MAPQQIPATAIAALTRTPLPQMTEAQLRGMDGKQYMGEAHKRCFRALLVSMKELLEARARSAAAEIAVGTVGADPIDRASAEEEHQLAIAARARDSAQLLEVRAAIRRLDADEFGWCIETGEEIGLGRLLICPTTTLCVEAQQRRENTTNRYRS